MVAGLSSISSKIFVQDTPEALTGLGSCGLGPRAVKDDIV
jgi:hypothetical protein